MSSAQVPWSHGRACDESEQPHGDSQQGDGVSDHDAVSDKSPRLSGSDLYALWKDRVCPLLEDRGISVGCMPQMMVAAQVACNRTLRTVERQNQAIFSKDTMAAKFSVAIDICVSQVSSLLHDCREASAEDMREPLNVLFTELLEKEGLFEDAVKMQFRISAEDEVRASRAATTGASTHPIHNGSGLDGCLTRSTCAQATFTTGQPEAPVMSALGPLSQVVGNLPVSCRPGQTDVMQFGFNGARELGMLIANVLNCQRPASIKCPEEASPIMKAAVQEIKKHPAFTIQRVYSEKTGPSIWCDSGELLSSRSCSQIPKVAWAIIFGHLSVGTGMSDATFYEQLWVQVVRIPEADRRMLTLEDLRTAVHVAKCVNTDEQTTFPASFTYRLFTDRVFVPICKVYDDISAKLQALTTDFKKFVFASVLKTTWQATDRGSVQQVPGQEIVTVNDLLSAASSKADSDAKIASAAADSWRLGSLIWPDGDQRAQHAAENGVPDEELFGQALLGVLSDGASGPLASPIVILMLGWLCLQTQHLVIENTDAAGNPRLCVQLNNWRAPELTFSVLVWGLVQVIKLIWPKGRKTNTDKYLQDGVAAYAYSVLLGSDPRTEHSIVMKLSDGLNVSELDDALPDSVRFLVAHLTDGTFGSEWQLLPRPAEYPCWAAERLSQDTYTGSVQIKLPRVQPESGHADGMDSDHAGLPSVGGANLDGPVARRDERMQRDEGQSSGTQANNTQTVVAHILPPPAQFIKEAVAGVCRLELPPAADAEEEGEPVTNHGRPLGTAVKTLASLIQSRWGRDAAPPAGPPQLPLHEHLNFIRKAGRQQRRKGRADGKKQLENRGDSILEGRQKLLEFQPGGAGAQVDLREWVRAAREHFQ